MGKYIVGFLIICGLLFGCKHNGGNGGDITSGWRKTVDIGGGFAMGGASINGKTFIGSYGTGQMYSYPPINLDKDNTGEAVLDAVTFKGMVFTTSEANGQARVFRWNGGWGEIGIEGYASFFMTVWNDQLVVTSTRNLASIDVYISSDGNSFSRMATVNDWVWVPAAFRGELYLLGHSGPPYGPGGSRAMKWDGGRFVEVPALNNVPGVTEWQCATEHNGMFFVGAGGWTMNRGGSLAAVYQFDGSGISQSKVDGGFHEVQRLLSSRGVLYAAMGTGFKADNGGSMIWALSGGSWSQSGFFPDVPQLYVLVETQNGYIAAGGRQGQLVVYEAP